MKWRLRAALEVSQQARTAAEQQAAVLAAKLEGVSAQLAQQAEAYAEVRKQAARLAGQLEAMTAQERKSHERP